MNSIINNSEDHSMIDNLNQDFSTKDLFEKCALYNRASFLKQNSIYPYYQEVMEVNGSKVLMSGESKLMLGGNNYLGVANHPILKKAAKDAIDKYGIGSTGARIISGTFDLHSQFEEKLSRFFNKEATVIFTTGYQTNTGVVGCLVGRHEHIVLDSQAHASIVDGSRISFGKAHRFRHNDMVDLERILANLSPSKSLTIVDGVYSMGGDLADLPKIVYLCKKYKSKLMVDEAHGFGVFGINGAGVAEHFSVQDDVDIIVGTFSKACGAMGGFASAKGEVIDYIKHNARGLLFSTGMPAAILAAADAAFSHFILPPERRSLLWNITRKIKQGLIDLGFVTGVSQSPIIPVIIGDDIKTTTFWRKLFEDGIFVGAMIPPAVPPKESLLRISCSANISDDEILFLLSRFSEIGKNLGLR